MEKSVVDRVAKTLVDQANNVSETVGKAQQFTSQAADCVQDSLNTAKNAVQDSREAVQDFIGDTAQRVKSSPIQAILISATVGFVFGLLLGRATGD